MKYGLNNWISSIERIGNRLPHPTMLFIWLCLLMLLFSAASALLQIAVQHPDTGQVINARNLLGNEGLRYIFTSLVGNFTSFAPLGVVLVAMLGIGIAEHSNLIATLLGKMVQRVSGHWLVILVAFAGVLSSIAADAGYVVLIPLAASLFAAAGRPPLVGIAVAFAAVSGGFSANLLLGPVDALLAGLSTEAARLLNPDAYVSPASNYWFIIASTFLVVAVTSLVASLWLEPKLEKRPAASPELQQTEPCNGNPTAQRMRPTLIAFILFIFSVSALTLPESAPLRDPITGSLVSGPFMKSIVVLIAIGFAFCGCTFGFSNGYFTSSKQVIESMERTMRDLGGYLVLMFFAAQFVAWFSWSNLGIIFAISAAQELQQWSLPTPALLISLILLCATINLFIGSASAKWALLAPVLIPLLMTTGVAPEAVQAAYRVGDSSTNIITPLMPYFALVLGFARRYQPETGIGTLAAMMLPFSMVLLICWSILLALWIQAGWSLGF